MSPTTPNLHILESIRDDLLDFSSPDNQNGFFPSFCEWVLREWKSRPYYITETVNFGHDLSSYPQKTDLLLREKAESYRDFIHANNGQYYATCLPHDESPCATMEKNLYDFFHESMRLRALTFLEENYPEMEAEVFWNQIFCEDFTRREDLLIVEEITLHFGFYGLAAEPYTSHPSDCEESGEGRFSQWTLKDFEAARDHGEAPSSSTYSKRSFSFAAPSPIFLEVLRLKAFKKPLSQNDSFA